MSSIWGQANPTGVTGYNTTSETSATYGVWFTVAKAGTLTGIWFYSPSGATTLPTATAVWSATSQFAGTLLNQNASPSWSGAAGSGWVQDTSFPATSLASGTVYIAGYYIGATAVGQAYLFTGSSPAAWFPTTSADGNITAPQSEFSINNAPYISGASIAFPTNDNGNNINWLADVQVSFTSASPPPPGWLPLPPGWFPGADAAATEPDGIPFYQQPIATDATPAPAPPVPVPPALPYQAPLLPPGWFPGSDAAATEPDGIPFFQAPPPVADPGAVPIAPPPPPYPPYAPTAPNWFPGASAVIAAPDGIPFYVQPQPDSSPPLPSTPYPPYIAGLGGTPGPGWFTDQHGNPRLWVASETWSLPVRAGEWTTPAGNWKSDYDNFFSARAAQGLTVTMTDVMQSSADTGAAGPYINGNTWDDISPWVNGTDASGGLNSAFWTRIDYMMNSALRNGIAIGFTLNVLYDSMSAGCPFFGWSGSQFQAYGTAVGTRYASQPNIVWLFGNDNYQGSYDTQMTAFLTGLRAGGANQVAGPAWWEAEYTSRYETDNNTAITWGETYSPVNFCYTYNAEYWVIEYAYSETLSPDNQANQLPAIQGDGYFEQGGSSYSSTYDRAARQKNWWVLASGGRGILSENEAVYSWASSAALTLVQDGWFWNNNLASIVTAYTGFGEWWKLTPDLSSAFVTGGRGTRVTGFSAGGGGGQYEPAFTNSWVAASITPDGSLAVLYLPNATTVTINTAMLGPGYTATWIDPVTGAASSAGTGSTYNSTAKGANSQGDPDWVLIFQGPPGPWAQAPGIQDWQPLPPGWYPGADAVTTVPAGIPFWQEPQPTDQNALPPAGAAVSLADTAAGADTVAAVVTGNIAAVIQAPPVPAGPAPPPIPAQVIYPGGAAAVPADAAGAADALTVTVTVALADQGAAVDDQPGELTISAALALADTGAAADAQAAVTLSSQPVLLQAPPLYPGPPLAPPAQVITALAQAPVAITLADAAGAADAITVTVTVPLAEDAGAADAITAAVTVPLADAGAGADAAAAVTAGNITAVITAPPQPSGPPPPPVPAQVLGPAGVALAEADAGAGADAITAAVAVPLPDVAAAAETVVPAAVTAAADPAGAADAVAVTVTSIAPAVIQAPPNPAGPPPPPVPAQVLGPAGVALAQADTAGAADTLLPAVAVALADAGAGADNFNAGNPYVYDQAGAADQITAQLASICPAVIAGPPPPAPVYPQVPPQVITGQLPPVTVTLAEVAAAADALLPAAAVPVPDTGAAADAPAAQVAAALPEAAAAADAALAAVTTLTADAAAAADTASAAALVPLADDAAADEALLSGQPTSYADAAGASDAIQAAPSVPLADAGGAADALQGSAAAALSDVSGAAETFTAQSSAAYTGHVEWNATPAPPRWTAQPAAPRWHASPALSRWKAVLMNFAPIAAISLEEVNVLWSSSLAGTEVDPTGVSPGSTLLTVQFAFPQSSGNPLEPAEPSSWFTGSWLTGTNIAGYVAQALVGPGGGVVTLTAGLQYDVWSEVVGTPESPRKFCGTLPVF